MRFNTVPTIAKFTSLRLAYRGSDEFRGCFRVREDPSGGAADDEAGEAAAAGPSRKVASSSTSAGGIRLAWECG